MVDKDERKVIFVTKEMSEEAFRSQISKWFKAGEEDINAVGLRRMHNFQQRENK